eukprot:6895675-Lingulodinium_polyedra.AAC.1
MPWGDFDHAAECRRQVVARGWPVQLGIARQQATSRPRTSAASPSTAVVRSGRRRARLSVVVVGKSRKRGREGEHAGREGGRPTAVQ